MYILPIERLLPKYTDDVVCVYLQTNLTKHQEMFELLKKVHF